MIRRFTCGFYRTASFCLLLLLIAMILKRAYPVFGAKVGAWIAGADRPGAVRAITAFFRSLTSGAGFTRAVEVFRETIQCAAGG